MDQTQTKVLIIETNHTLARMLSSGINNRFGLSVDSVGTLLEASKIISEQHPYFLALCNLILPDAPNGEAMDLVIQRKLPVVAMTTSDDQHVRKHITAKPIADYVAKDHPEYVDYLIERVGEIYRNRQIKALVVDDSDLDRNIMIKLLRIQQFTVFEAKNGADALKIVEKNHDIKIVLTDYNMPIMNGLEFTIALRRKYRREAMAIIAISSESASTVSSQLLRLGASDFIRKPFIKEEFDCRINNTVRSLENLEKMSNLASYDYLTDLFNRRRFFSACEEFEKEQKMHAMPFSTAMIDLDKFKTINDNYGHDAGDKTLKIFANIIKKHTRRSDIAARFGGEEFCIVLKNLSSNEAMRIFDTIRSELEQTVITLPNKQSFSCTVSMGVCSDLDKTISEMIFIADKRLYMVKNTGKNRICAEG